MRAHRDMGLVSRATLPGSILVEVIVAIAILGVFLGGLSRAFQGAFAAAVDFRTRAGSLPTDVPSSRISEAWGWGPMVDSVDWGPGPALSVTLGSSCEGEMTVGAWSDGWLVGEWPVRVCAELGVAALVWQGLVGSEVVVRVRGVDGAWGAPWRTVVPDPYGHIAADLADASGESESAVTGFWEAKAVTHQRNLGSPLFKSSWSTVAFEELVEDSVVLLEGAGSGVCILESDERSQSWVGVEGRQFDVYW